MRKDMKEPGVYERKLIIWSETSKLKCVLSFETPGDPEKPTRLHQEEVHLPQSPHPQLSAVSDTKQCWNKPYLWMERIVIATNTPSFMNERSTIQMQAKGRDAKWTQGWPAWPSPGSLRIGMSHWTAGKTGRLRGRTQKSRWSSFRTMREHSLLFSATWYWTSWLGSEMSFTSTKGFVEIPKEKKNATTPPDMHTPLPPSSVWSVSPRPPPHCWLIISETFAAIAWVYFFPFPGSTTVLLCRKVTDGMQMCPFAFLYCHHSDSDLEGGSVAFFENTQM